MYLSASEGDALTPGYISGLLLTLPKHLPHFIYHLCAAAFTDLIISNNNLVYEPSVSIRVRF